MAKKNKTVDLKIKLDYMKFILKRSGFKFNDKGLKCLYEDIKAIFPDCDVVDLEQFSIFFKSFLMENHPDIPLFYEFYYHEKINNIVVYLVCHRLQIEKLKASKQTIHELCFLAETMFYDNLYYENFSHTVNCVIKIYREKQWFQPFDFLCSFPEYKE